MKNEQTQEANLTTSTDKKTKTKPKQTPKLVLTVQTWQKQSHGLYDYQSPLNKIFKEDLLICESSRIFRNSVSTYLIKKQMREEVKNIPDRIEIFNVQYSPGHKCYILKNSLSTQLETVMLGQRQQAQNINQKHKLFVSLSPEGQGHKLVIGDFIKLGRVELVVLQINNEKKTESIDYQEVYGARQFIFHLKEELQGSCKVCLSDEATEQDPLVNPCDCKGSCGVIHIGCLKNWINNKVKKEFLEKVITYNFEKFSCQICKAPFPTKIRLENGSQTFLLNFQRPSSPYILLQQCSQTEQKHARTLHFIYPNEDNKVSIGRGQTCELMISDISVSRNHSYVTYERNHFYIFDMGSKFGTLVQLKQQLEVNKDIRLQHNGCSINIGPKQQKSLLSSKSGKKSAPKNSSN